MAVDDFVFYAPGVLAESELRLELRKTLLDAGGAETLPTYCFRLLHTADGAELGFINLRVGSGENLTLYRGHIGYGVESAFRGRGYAVRACRLLPPLARRHGLDPLWITCSPDNIASRKTCERLGARLVEIVIVPEDTEACRAGARVKCRYCLTV